MKLLEESENERMHLWIWLKVCSPTLLERLLVIGTQGVFLVAFTFFYAISPKTAHRFTGYLEEEACVSYTHMIKDIDAGIIPNNPAPKIAIDYYHLPSDARIRDVAVAVRADEAHHRDVNHEFADKEASRGSTNAI